MTEQALSHDTDKRFVETVVARQLVDRETLVRISDEYDRDRALGKTTGSLAELLCAKGVLDRRTAAEILRDVRALRGRDSTWPKEPARTHADSDDAAIAGGTPNKIGEYILERELGRGGMGSVWLGRHGTTGAQRALKLLDGVADAERLARFRLEAEALARVGGDTVVPVHEIGVARGRIFFVMGVMNGGSLRKRLDEKGPLDWREAVRLAVTLARALERCHEVGLIHRDLKPDNVLLDTGGRPRLADFGVARDLQAASLTETGTVLGTPVYMPPEQLAGLKVDARADIYALGALLHELISGHRPFGGKTVIDVFEAKKAGAAEPLPKETPPEVAAVIARALSPRVDLRHASARELAEDLERLVASEPRRRSPVRALVWLLGVGLAVLLVEAVVLVVKREGPPGPVVPVPPPQLPGAKTDDLVAANRLLLLAAAKLSLEKGSVDEALKHVIRAREACPNGAIPAEGLKSVLREVTRRLELIPSRAVFPQPGTDFETPFDELRKLRKIAAKLEVEVPISTEIATFAGTYAMWKGTQKPRQWGPMFEATLIQLPKMNDNADDVASWVVECLKEGPGPYPETLAAVVESAWVAVPDAKRTRCAIMRVEYFALTDQADRMVEAALEALARPETVEARDRTAAVVLAIRHLRPPRPLAADRVEALVRAGGETPELLLLRAEHVPERRDDVALAVERGLLWNEHRSRAAVLIVTDGGLRRRTFERFFASGRADLVAQVLSDSRIPEVQELVGPAFIARTPEEQRAVLERLDRRN